MNAPTYSEMMRDEHRPSALSAAERARVVALWAADRLSRAERAELRDYERRMRS